MKRNASFLYIILLAVLTSCVGTDFTDEPLGPVPTRIETSAKSLVLLEGGSQQLSAQVIASDESIVDESLSWLSRNPSIATVDEDGLVMAVSSGQVWIDVLSQTLEDSVLVTVSVDPEALASVVITTNEMSLTISETLQLEVELSNANGDILTNKMVSWSSSDPNICSVTSTGLVTALAEGSAQITASSEGLNSVPITLMVGSDSVSLVRMGTFQGKNGYSVTGIATLDGSDDPAVLTFDSDFQTQNGPGLYVYLSPNANNVNGGVDLGKLKSTSGEQTYNIPSNVNLADFDHVIIFCQPFRVPFGSANLQ